MNKLSIFIVISMIIVDVSSHIWNSLCLNRYDARMNQLTKDEVFLQKYYHSCTSGTQAENHFTRGYKKSDFMRNYTSAW